MKHFEVFSFPQKIADNKIEEQYNKILSISDESKKNQRYEKFFKDQLNLFVGSVRGTNQEGEVKKAFVKKGKDSQLNDVNKIQARALMKLDLSNVAYQFQDNKNKDKDPKVKKLILDEVRTTLNALDTNQRLYDSLDSAEIAFLEHDSPLTTKAGLNRQYHVNAIYANLLNNNMQNLIQMTGEDLMPEISKLKMQALALDQVSQISSEFVFLAPENCNQKNIESAEKILNNQNSASLDDKSFKKFDEDQSALTNILLSGHIIKESSLSNDILTKSNFNSYKNEINNAKDNINKLENQKMLIESIKKSFENVDQDNDKKIIKDIERLFKKNGIKYDKLEAVNSNDVSSVFDDQVKKIDIQIDKLNKEIQKFDERQMKPENQEQNTQLNNIKKSITQSTLAIALNSKMKDSLEIEILKIEKSPDLTDEQKSEIQTKKTEITVINESINNSKKSINTKMQEAQPIMNDLLNDHKIDKTKINDLQGLNKESEKLTNPKKTVSNLSQVIAKIKYGISIILDKKTYSFSDKTKAQIKSVGRAIKEKFAKIFSVLVLGLKALAISVTAASALTLSVPVMGAYGLLGGGVIGAFKEGKEQVNRIDSAFDAVISTDVSEQKGFVKKFNEVSSQYKANRSKYKQVKESIKDYNKTESTINNIENMMKAAKEGIVLKEALIKISKDPEKFEEFRKQYNKNHHEKISKKDHTNEVVSFSETSTQTRLTPFEKKFPNVSKEIDSVLDKQKSQTAQRF